MKIFFILSLVLFSACTGSRTTIEENKTETSKIAEVTELIFGGGGGFTGEMNMYILKVNGTVLEGEKLIKKISAQKAVAFYIRAEALKNYAYNAPGNMYSLLEIKSKDQKNTIVWEDRSEKVDVRVLELHKELMRLVKN